MQELIEIMMEEWGEGRGLPDWAEQALEKEKEQIINAYCDGFVIGSEGNEIMSEEYYNQTFKK